MLTSRASASLIGAWIIAAIIGIVTGVSIRANYENVTQTNPEYKATTQTFDLGKFNALEAKNGQRITLRQGTEYGATVRGHEKDIAFIQVENVDGTLHVTRKSNDKVCFFCFSESIEIEVTAPLLTSIKAENATRISSDKFSVDTLTLTSENGSRITLYGTTTATTLRTENASSIYLTGSTKDLNASLSNGSRLEASDFKTQTAEVRATNASHAEVFVEKQLTATAENGSRVVQHGKASVDLASYDESSGVRNAIIQDQSIRDPNYNDY